MKDVAPGTSKIISRPTEDLQAPHAKLKQFDHEPCGTRVEVDGQMYQKSVAGKWWPRYDNRSGGGAKHRNATRLHERTDSGGREWEYSDQSGTQT